MFDLPLHGVVVKTRQVGVYKRMHGDFVSAINFRDFLRGVFIVPYYVVVSFKFSLNAQKRRIKVEGGLQSVFIEYFYKFFVLRHAVVKTEGYRFKFSVKIFHN